MRNKFVRFSLYLLFALTWFVVSIYIWDYVYAWLEYKIKYYDYFWLEGSYFVNPLPISFLLIFVSPYYFFQKYIWNKKKK